MGRKRPRRPRPAPGGSPPRRSGRLYLRLAAKDLVLLKFLLESEDNLAYLTVIDKFTALARLTHSPGQADEVLAFLDRVRDEMDVHIIEPVPVPLQA